MAEDAEGWAALGWSGLEAYMGSVAKVRARIANAYEDDRDLETVRAGFPPDGMVIHAERLMALAVTASHVQVRTIAGREMGAERAPSDSEALDIMRGVLGADNTPLSMSEVTPGLAQHFMVQSQNVRAAS